MPGGRVALGLALVGLRTTDGGPGGGEGLYIRVGRNGTAAAIDDDGDVPPGIGRTMVDAAADRKCHVFYHATYTRLPPGSV